MTIQKTSKYFIAVTSVLLAFLTALSPFGIDTYLSAMPVMVLLEFSILDLLVNAFGGMTV